MSAASGTIFLLKRAELAARGCVERALLQAGLTPTQFHVLLLLERNPGISAAQVARSVGIRPQSVNDSLGPLERKGLLLRRPSAAHRRQHPQADNARRRRSDAPKRVGRSRASASGNGR